MNQLKLAQCERGNLARRAKIDPLRAKRQPIESISWVAQLLLLHTYGDLPRFLLKELLGFAESGDNVNQSAK